MWRGSAAEQLLDLGEVGAVNDSVRAETTLARGRLVLVEVTHTRALTHDLAAPGNAETLLCKKKKKKIFIQMKVIIN